ncbi:hypothetical protein [Micromonospora parva]|uniref:hypothetical protein n=1 Tax=Micromonospora parva TaxID=1464048 RepID=UPI00340A1F76
MINLPVLNRLDIDDYGLYPGTEKNPGLHVDFHHGLTLVLGSNGLGKTTLVTILYRMLAGPTDIPTLDVGGDLGDRRLEAKEIPQRDRRVFANRVRDGASEAVAKLTFWLGDTEISVNRDLQTLEMSSLTVGGVPAEATDQEYQKAVLRHAGLVTYGDWILVLRHLTFYFEDRRALVWDPTAQRQLLRLLFLMPEESRGWRKREREILELDSTIRNYQYMLGREEKAAAKNERAVGGQAEVRQQLRLLEGLQESELERLADLNERLATATADRQVARVNALTAEQAHESALRDVERLQLHAVEAAFPKATETARYILGHLLADEECLTCGSHVPELAREIQERMRSSGCPVCGSDMTGGKARHHSTVSRGLARATRLVQASEAQKDGSNNHRLNAEKAYEDLVDEISSLTTQTSRRAAEINSLLRRLPPDEREIHKQRDGLAIMRGKVEQQKRELLELRQSFEAFVQEVNQTISLRKGSIKAAFDEFATGFLFEDCSLKWSPRRSKVGQSGGLVEFAAFELDMSGANFVSPVRRDGPQQVSESQREFIDLSFRMALMLVASPKGGSLVIDAPESSLDAVFVKRAADVLTRFGQARPTNRLVVTSNLVDGNLIPELLRKSSIRSSRDRRVVDLLRVAAPTAATRLLKQEYAHIKRDLFARAAPEGVE